MQSSGNIHSLLRDILVKRLNESVDRKVSEFLIIQSQRFVFVQLNCSNLLGTCFLLSSCTVVDQYALNKVLFGLVLPQLKSWLCEIIFYGTERSRNDKKYQAVASRSSISVVKRSSIESVSWCEWNRIFQLNVLH